MSISYQLRVTGKRRINGKIEIQSATIANGVIEDASVIHIDEDRADDETLSKPTVTEKGAVLEKRAISQSSMQKHLENKGFESPETLVKEQYSNEVIIMFINAWNSLKATILS